MVSQSEIEMELALFSQLERLGYSAVELKNDADLVANFKAQLEAFNDTVLSQDEFSQVLVQMDKGDVYDRSKRLYEHLNITNSSGDVRHLKLFESKDLKANRYQVARQITNKADASYSRYDVTILINGLPLVQVELKKRGVSLDLAFRQIDQYRKRSYSSNSGLFQYIQLFVISNGVDTQYFANNKTLRSEFRFNWTDEDNTPINRIEPFAEAFLNPDRLAKMVGLYTVRHCTSRALMVLRPYQVYAVEGIVERVEFGRGDGYIWHTTGSGKTLTSFKTSQILSKAPGIDKVVFVVDRRDLDHQTAEEFNSFSKGSVDSTDNTRKLVEQLNDPGCKLILTTIQKLSAAILRKKFRKQIKGIRGNRMVFIFDECHRSQFGDSHQRICDFFEQRQMFGFTGTPIFDENSVGTKAGQRTTRDLFGDMLHRYVITDAIRDQNVLRLAIEYRLAGVKSEGGGEAGASDRPLVSQLASPYRIETVADDILAIHGHKTYDRGYNAMMCVASVDILKQYYQVFKQKRLAGEHFLNIATIFSCSAGSSSDDNLEEDIPNMEAREIDRARMNFLRECVSDYNHMFNTSYRADDNKSFYEYYQNVSERVKKREVDILLVVNMFLTGYDSPPLNTLYVDKNLKDHGLIQAFSRTNRVYDSRKSHGNIVCYRPLKEATDSALSLFANERTGQELGDVIGTVIMSPYEDLLAAFQEEVANLKAVAPTVDAVDEIVREDEIEAFVERFKNVARMKSALSTFVQFEDDLEEGVAGIDQDGMNEYQSKFLRLKERVENETKAAKKARQEERRSRAEDSEDEVEELEEHLFDRLDFEIEMLHRDEVNVSYILDLVANRLGSAAEGESAEGNYEEILREVRSDPKLNKQRRVIETFIERDSRESEGESDSIGERFKAHQIRERNAALMEMATEFEADLERLRALYEEYRFKGRLPDDAKTLEVLAQRPGIRQRKVVADSMRERMAAIAVEHGDLS